MATTIGTINNATYASSTNPLAAQHFYDLSPSSQLAILGRKKSMLYAMTMAGRGLKKRRVTDKIYKTLQNHPMIKDILIIGDDGAGGNLAGGITTTSQYFHMTDVTATITDARVILRVGDRLLVHPYQDNQSTAVGTVAVAGEVMEVASIAAGGTYFTCTRNIGSSGTSANVASNATGASLHARLQGAAMSERQTPRQVLAHGLLTIENYIQNFSESFETTDDLEATLLVGGSYWDRQRAEKLDAIMSDINESLLWGRKGISVQGGDPKYSTLGFFPMILGDGATYGTYTASKDLVTGNATSRIWQVGNPENLTPRNMNTFMQRAFGEGSDNKILVCGGGFFNKYIMAFEGYFTFDLHMPDPDGIPWNMTGIRYGNKRLPVIVDDSFNGPRENDAGVLDMDHTGICDFGTGDVHEWGGKIAELGTGENANGSHVLQHCFEAQLGADMDYKDAGAYIIGLKNDDATYGGIYPTVGTQTPSTI